MKISIIANGTLMGLILNWCLLHERFCLQGLWRGDPCRPVTVVDTPGLGGEDGRDDEVW